MSSDQARIISYGSKATTSQTDEWHDGTGHHRYYGSSATNGGERIVESRRGRRPRGVNLLGF